MHPAAQALHEQVVRGRTPGLQYLHFDRDSILFRFRDGVADVARHLPVGPATTFNGFSVTKTVTAVAVIQLGERGELSLDAPAVTYLTRFPYDRRITVRQLLTHSAGIPNPIPLRWTHPVEAHGTFDRDAFFRGVYAEHPRTRGGPNEKFAYSNLGYELLGELIEAVSGRSYEEYVTENVLERLAIPATDLGFVQDPEVQAAGYHKRTSLTYPILGFLLDRESALAGREDGWQRFRPFYMNGAAYGGLVGTADGFARYLQALLDPGGALLSPRSRDQLFTENVLSGGSRSGMTHSWFVGQLGGTRFYDHAGGGGGYYAEIRLYPELGRGSVLLANRTGLRNERLLDRIDRHLISGLKPTAGEWAR